MVSHQDKLKPQHSHLPTDNLLHQILKELSPGYIGPKAFLSLQQKNPEISYEVSHKEFQPKAYCNKYFGKKVLYVTDSCNSNRAMNSCKLFQKVKFDKGTLPKEEFKAVGDLILIGKEVPIQMNQIAKAVKGCRGKVSIVLNQNIYQYTEIEMYHRERQQNPIVSHFHVWMKKWIRNCHANLQSLSLTFQSVDQFPISTENLRNLRHLSVKFDKKFARKCGWKCDIFPEYTFEDFQDKSFILLLKFIKQCNKLQTVRLDLAPYSITSTSLAYLLLTLNYHEVPDWYIRIGTVSEAFLEILKGMNIEEIDKMPPAGLKSTSEVLKNVDFLGVYVVNYLESVPDEPAYAKYEDYGAFRMSVARLGELPEVTCRYKRILDVTLKDFSLDRPLVNLKTILSQFPGLQGLYVKAVENVVLYEDNDENLHKKFKRIFNVKEESEETIQNLEEAALSSELGWTRNLQEVFISFLELIGINDKEFESQTQSFSRLMRALKTQCPHLASLQVFRGHPVFDTSYQLTFCNKVPFSASCDKIIGMKTDKAGGHFG